jgi:predicted nucleic acid-binding protein
VIVVDASVIADFLLARPEALEAIDRALEDDRQQPLHAPELIEPQTLNALRGLVIAGALGEERATGAAEDLALVRLVRHSHAPLRPRVWELRHDLTAYDASYLALAEALDEPVLLTGDAGLAARGRRSLGDDRVALVR